MTTDTTPPENKDSIHNQIVARS